MKAHQDAGYWNRGESNVPQMTGAVGLEDAADLRAIAAALGIKIPFARALDVGCGTGRAAQVCDGNYVGADISVSAVEYCARRGRAALLIAGPDDLPPGPFGIILAISVFTHMDRDERRAYLRAFNERTNAVLVDIIRGDGSGSIAVWTAREEDVIDDFRDIGFAPIGPIDFKWDDHVHTYFYARSRRELNETSTSVT